jgi:hypothetical protein
MAYNLAGLTPYTEQDAKKLIYKIIAHDDMSKYMNVQTGIKTAETINIISTEGVWQAATNCNPTASGDSAITQRTLTVGQISIVLEWCEEQLEEFYTQKAMVAGSTFDMLTFRNQIVDDVIQNIHKRKSVAIWQGDTTSGSAYLDKFDGLIKIIGAASGVVTATPVAWSVANSRTAVQNVLTRITNDMLAQGDKLKIFMGTAEARDYRLKIGIDNLYHMTGADAKLYAENTNVEIVPVIGLSGTKRVYAISTDNMYLGTDLKNEEEKLQFKVLENEKIRLTIKTKYGVQIAFPDQIVSQANT